MFGILSSASRPCLNLLARIREDSTFYLAALTVGCLPYLLLVNFEARLAVLVLAAVQASSLSLSVTTERYFDGASALCFSTLIVRAVEARQRLHHLLAAQATKAGMANAEWLTMRFSDSVLEHSYNVTRFQRSYPTATAFLICYPCLWWLTSASLAQQSAMAMSTGLIVLTAGSLALLAIRMAASRWLEAPLGQKVYSWAAVCTLALGNLVQATADRFQGEADSTYCEAVEVATNSEAFAYVASFLLLIAGVFLSEMALLPIPRAIMLASHFLVHSTTTCNVGAASGVVAGYLAAQTWEASSRVAFLGCGTRSQEGATAINPGAMLRLADDLEAIYRLEGRKYDLALTAGLTMCCIWMAQSTIVGFIDWPAVLSILGYITILLLSMFLLNTFSTATTKDLMFSISNFLATAVVCAALSFFQWRSRFFTNLSSTYIVLMFASCSCTPIFQRAFALPPESRIPSHFVVCIMFYNFPEPGVSLIGQPNETYLIIASLMMGELIGHMLESVWRSNWLLKRQNAHNLATAKAEAADAVLRRCLHLAYDLMAQIEVHDDGVWVTHVSRSYESGLGHAADTLVGGVSKVAGLFRDPTELSKRLAASYVPGLAPEVWEDVMVHADGRELSFEHSLSRNSETEHTYLLVSRDVTERLIRQRAEIRAVQLEAEAAAEREHAASRALQISRANRIADSKLNHIVKNQCGEASMRLQTLLMRMASDAPPSAVQIQSILGQATADLDQVAVWVYQREVLLQVETGEYRSRKSPCLVGQLVARAMGDDGRFSSPDDTSLACEVDEKVLHLAVIEALSNARKHRVAGSSILAHVCLEHGEDGDSIESALQLHVWLDNVSASVASEEVLACAFEKGHSGKLAPMASTGVGLASVLAAVNAAQGRTWLSSSVSSSSDNSSSSGDVAHTRFHVVLPATAMASNAPDSHSLTSKPLDPGPLVCVGIDDDRGLREVQEMIFSHALNADMSASVSIGATGEEQNAFVDLALGRLDRNLQLVPIAAQRHADVALVDQNIHLEGRSQCLLGSDLAVELHRQGFRGITCIMTGASIEEIERLGAIPGVDLVVSKMVHLPSLARDLRASLAAKRKRVAGLPDLPEIRVERSASGDQAAGANVGEVPRAETVLLNTSLVLDMPPPMLKQVVFPLVDDEPHGGCAAELRVLESYLDDPVRLKHSRHKLSGQAQLIGAVLLEKEVKALTPASGPADFERIRTTIKRTKQALLDLMKKSGVDYT